MADFSGLDALEYSFVNEGAGKQSERMSGEQRLWCAVISQAITDAENGSSKAREWLLYERDDFVFACTLAGIAPFSVRSAARKLMAKQWR